MHDNLGSLLIVFLLILPLGVHAQSYAIDAASWQQPRSAMMVKSLPAVKAAINKMRSTVGSKLVIRHQDDEEGSLWGAELRDWLVSLGIEPDTMRIEIMDVSPAVLQLEVTGKSGAGL